MDQSPGAAANTERSPERSPAKTRPSSQEIATSSNEIVEADLQGLFEMLRRVRGVGERLRERESLGSGEVVTRSNSSGGSGEQRDSRSSMRSGWPPPGFDLGQI